MFLKAYTFKIGLPTFAFRPQSLVKSFSQKIPLLVYKGSN